MSGHRRAVASPRRNDEPAIRRFAAEFVDPETEARYRRAVTAEHARSAQVATAVAIIASCALALLEAVSPGHQPPSAAMLAIRAAFVVPALVFALEISRRPQVVHNHLLVSALCATLLLSDIALGTMRPATGLDHLTVGTAVLAIYTLVPNRLVWSAVVCGGASAIWVGVSAAQGAGSPGAAATAVVMAVALLVGHTAAYRAESLRRRAFAFRLDQESAATRLAAELHQHRRLRSDLIQRANTDPLTGIANRRHFLDQVEVEFRRAQRTPQPVSVLVLDLDHFKAVNDTHGHQAGDEVLRRVSHVLLELVRRVDVVGRLGGEEFAIVMPGADLGKAREIAERLCTRVRAQRIELPTGVVHPTVSVGIADADVWTDRVEDVLARADDAMYAAKSRGRDRIVVAGVLAAHGSIVLPPDGPPDCTSR